MFSQQAWLLQGFALDTPSRHRNEPFMEQCVHKTTGVELHRRFDCLNTSYVTCLAHVRNATHEGECLFFHLE